MLESVTGSHGGERSGNSLGSQINDALGYEGSTVGTTVTYLSTVSVR